MHPTNEAQQFPRPVLAPEHCGLPLSGLHTSQPSGVQSQALQFLMWADPPGAQQRVWQDSRMTQENTTVLLELLTTVFGPTCEVCRAH